MIRIHLMTSIQVLLLALKQVKYMEESYRYKRTLETINYDKGKFKSNKQNSLF